jgi:flagellin FlaB
MVGDHAFTGLEAGIVLIAFIIVGAVFSNLAIGSGIIVSRDAEKIVHTGVSGAGSALCPSGEIFGIRTTLTNPYSIRSILIPLRIIGRGEGIDVRTMRIRVISAGNKEELTLNGTYMNVSPLGGRWSVQRVLNSDGDTLIENGEEFIINATLTYSGDMVPYQRFSVEIKPDQGTALRIVQTVPAAIDPITIFE